MLSVRVGQSCHCTWLHPIWIDWSRGRDWLYTAQTGGLRRTDGKWVKVDSDKVDPSVTVTSKPAPWYLPCRCRAVPGRADRSRTRPLCCSVGRKQKSWWHKMVQPHQRVDTESGSILTPLFSSVILVAVDFCVSIQSCIQSSNFSA